MKNYSLTKLQPKSLSYGFLSFMSALALLLITSCGGGGGGVSSEHVQIPKDVAYVVSIDFKQLTAKSNNWKELMNKDFLESIGMDVRDSKEIFQLLQNGGIDYQKKGYIFGSLSKEKNDIICFSFLLSDPTKFEKALTKIEDISISTTGKDGFKFAAYPDKIIGWRGKSALFMGLEEGLEKTEGVFKEFTEEIEELKYLIERFEEVFNTEAGKSLSSKSKEFTQIDGAGHDFAYWVDVLKYNALNDEYDTFSDFSPAFSELNKLALYSTGGVSFDKGAIKSTHQYHLDQDLSRQYEELLKSGIHNNVIKSIPIAEPSTILGFGLSMKVLYERLKNEDFILDGDEDVKKEYGFGMKEMFEIFDGDFLLNIKDLKPDDLIIDPQPDFVFAVGIANKKNLQKIIDTHVEQGQIVDKGGFYEMKALVNPIYLFEKGDILYLTMTEKYKNDILSGQGSLKGKYAQAVSNKSFVVYLDVENTLKQFPDYFVRDSREMSIFKEEISPELEDMILDVQPIKSHKLNTEVAVNFKDKSKNSLVIIADIMKKMKSKDKKLSLQ